MSPITVKGACDLTTFKSLVALQFATSDDFEANLDTLISLIHQAPDNSLILAPEVCLTGFFYADMAKATAFSHLAKEVLLGLSTHKSIALTMIENGFNTFYLFSQNRIVRTQHKHKLFALGDEQKHFKAGAMENQLFEVNGLKVGVLICFELRFTELWQSLRGADIILVPAMWGLPRKHHFETLIKALAIANQCYVVASNSANEEMARGSMVVSPFGEFVQDDGAEAVFAPYDPKKITTMRKYINTGLI